MKIEQIKKIFEDDDSLKYALATNMAKYGRPQSKKSDKPAKLTKGLEKKREKAVKDLKKSMGENTNTPTPSYKDPNPALSMTRAKNKALTPADEQVKGKMKPGTYAGRAVVVHMNGPETEWKVKFTNSGKVVDYIDLMANLKFDDGTTYQDYLGANIKEMDSSFPGPDLDNKGYIAARKLIDRLRATTFRQFNDDELEEFRKEIANAFDMTLKEAFSGFRRGEPEDPDSIPFKPTGSVSQFQEDLRALFGKFKDDLKNPDFIRGVAQIMVNWKSLLRSQFDEGDTYEKMAAKGKKAGNLKQGTVRKRLGIPKDKKIPLNLINKELSRMKKMDKDDDKKGVQLGDKNQKYYKALQLAKTLKTTTNLNEDLSTLKKYKAQLDKLYGPQLRFIVNNDPNNPERSRIDVMGSQQELMNFGSEMHGTEMGDYEFFHVDDMDRGEMVSLVRSDSIMRGGSAPLDKISEKKDKTDRCLRIARQKMPKTSAYRSGLIVKCRKGMIWKKRK